MSHSTFKIALALVVSLAVAGLTGCISKGDTNVSGTGEKPTCNSICRHLSAETFGSCAKWTDYNDCVAECADHAPTDEGLSCAESSSTCDDFTTCDSKYDLF